MKRIEDKESFMNEVSPNNREEYLDHLVLEAQRRAPLDVAQILLDESDVLARVR